LAEVLDAAREEEVVIRRRDGDAFSVKLKWEAKSPSDIRGVRTKATTQDIIDAVRHSRSRGAECR